MKRQKPFQNKRIALFQKHNHWIKRWIHGSLFWLLVFLLLLLAKRKTPLSTQALLLNITLILSPIGGLGMAFLLKIVAIFFNFSFIVVKFLISLINFSMGEEFSPHKIIFTPLSRQRDLSFSTKEQWLKRWKYNAITMFFFLFLPLSFSILWPLTKEEILPLLWRMTLAIFFVISPFGALIQYSISYLIVSQLHHISPLLEGMSKLHNFLSGDGFKKPSFMAPLESKLWKEED